MSRPDEADGPAVLGFPAAVPVAGAVDGEARDAVFVDVGAGDLAGIPVAAAFMPAFLESSTKPFSVSSRRWRMTRSGT